MATLAELKARVILEMNKDDLAEGEESADALTTAIARAIEFHRSEQFWFNQGSDTATTTPGSYGVTIPSDVRVVRNVTYEGRQLRKVPLDSLAGATGTGPPCRWAEAGSSIVVWPTPDAVYTLGIYGVAETADADSDAYEGVWTNEAYDLIAARTRFLLYRDTYRDVEGSQLAAQAEGEELSRLRRETRRRGVTPLQSTGDEPWAAPTTFDIRRG